MDVSDALNNPLSLQNKILDEYVSRIEGDDIELVDANNTFTFMLETFSRIVAEATNAEDNKLNYVYPKRASKLLQLYPHISDYEYVGFYSYPASLELNIMFHKEYILRNAVAVPDTNYQLITIPVDTVFKIGRYEFSLYYPINIKINTLMGTVSASYDVTDVNPLKSLSSSSIEVKQDNYQGIDLISFNFNVYQFIKTIYKESINTKIGFIKKYSYSNKFYAIRIFDVTNGKTEVNYTLSDAVYDITQPTAIIKILTDENNVVVDIPQIYLTNGLIGSNIQVEIYTTLGEMDVSIANIELADITANFALTSPNTDLTYTNILKKIPTILITPTSSKIVGGSDNYDFETIKKYVIYHNNENNVPITRMDLEAFFEKNGFIYYHKLDNLTDRRYYAFKKLTYDDTVLGVINGSLTLSYNESETNDTVLYHDNNTIVILPTTIFRYNTDTRKLEILTNDERNIINNSSKKKLVNLINNDNLFCNPYHIVINTADKYPTATFYDLLSTEVNNITFIEENIYISAQMSLVSATIIHNNNGSGGYIVRVGMQRSDDISEVDITNICCHLSIVADSGYIIGLSGTYKETYNGLDIYDFELNTDYKISTDDLIITNMKAVDTEYTNDYSISLEGAMYVTTFIKKSLYSTYHQNDAILKYLTDDDNTWLSISLQKFDYVLGINLSDVIDPNLFTNWSSTTYQTYEVDVPLTYDHDVYETNDDGSLKYQIVDNEVVLNKLHSIGDQVYSNGLLIYKNKAGDVVLDANGDPISILSQIKNFTISINCYDYKHQLIIDDFLNNLALFMKSYYDTIIEMSNSVLENTSIFFAPIITTNLGNYRVNNKVLIESSLELSFVFNCYVKQVIYDDADVLTNLKNEIVKIIDNCLSNDIISLNEIAYNVQNILSSYILSIDALSINNMTDIQTLYNVDTERSPKIGYRLSLSTDGIYLYDPMIDITFKALDI